MAKLTAIASVELPSDKIDGYAYFRLTALAVDRGAAFLKVADAMADDLLHETPAAAA